MARDPKKFIERNVRETVEQYQQRPEVSVRFGEPVIEYVNIFHPLFDRLYMEDITEHPKAIYNPGHTIIVHYVPVLEDVEADLKANGPDAQRWEKAYYQSAMLAQFINKSIKESLSKMGRLSSITGVSSDWNMDMHMPAWSSKIVAYMAGIGSIGPAGSFHTKDGFIASIGTTITDGLYADECPEMTMEELDEEVRKIKAAFCYEDLADVACGEDMIAACPAAAISGKGIDKKKCLAYCATRNKRIPDPDICGLCFRFKSEE
ncbi:MAG: hypothetical protein Q4A65_04815 [Bacillota bacterium]|nr:hypothetical protein [Bacillota bacterium]